MTCRRLLVLTLTAAAATATFADVHSQNQVVAGVTVSAWRPLGPVNITGTITALSIDPRDSRVMTAVSPHGGIWRSVSGGAAWFPIETFFSQLTPGWHEKAFQPPGGALARDPRNPSVLVAGVGTVLARSTDGGATWSLLPSPGNTVPWLAWGPDGTLWRATNDQLWRSTDSGTSFQSVLTKFGGFSNISFHPFQPGRAIAAGNGDLYVTSDAGGSWTTIKLNTLNNATYSRVEYARGNPAVVYVISDGNLYKSQDGGSTFIKLSTIVPLSSTSLLWVDPVDAAHVLVTSQSDPLSTISETKDGGATFTGAGTVPPPGAFSSRAFQFVEKPGFNGSTNATVYMATWEGVFRCDNVNAVAPSGWQAINNGLATAEIVAGDAAGSTNTIVAAAERTGIVRYVTAAGDRSWAIAKRNLGAAPASLNLNSNHGVAIDKTDPSYVYARRPDGSVWRSKDGGQTFPDLLRGLTTTALALQPDDPNALVVASTQLDRTTNARAETPTFSTILAPKPFGLFTLIVNDFTFAPSKTTTGWAARDLHELLRSDDLQSSTPTWTTISFPGQRTQSQPILHLTIDPVDSLTVYAANAVAESDGLYRTRDAGATWTDISGPSTVQTAQEVAGQLPPWQQVYVLAVHPDRRTWLYAGTEAGVYASDDDGASWTFVGPTRAPVRHLFWMNRTLVAATYGRGLYAVDLSSTTGTLPSVAVDKTALSFGATSNGSAFVSQTPAQTIRLSQSGAGTVTWTAVADQPWITVTPSSGSGPASIAIGVTSAGGPPAPGSYTGSVTVSVSGSANGITPIALALKVMSAGTSAPPFGSFDVPATGSTIEGSVAVSGWALDDIGVERVEIWRDLQPGETTPPFGSTPEDPRTGKVFVATGAFVEGARPDVQAAFPSAPFSYRAGWGYLLLTWGLWNQGNGAYTLYAFAFDKESRVTLLGSKQVTANNAAATKPFGAIDTPGLGEVVSGTVVNFGWALTPKVNGSPTCRIPASGVQVSIDSGPLQPVNYGDPRPDVAAAFPGFSNSATAGGYFILDTTTLANGVHTIGWLITDDCGRVEGAGSRFFTVANAGR